MADTTTEHVVRISADTEGVTESLDRASDSMSKLESIAKRVSEKISAFWSSTAEDITESTNTLTSDLEQVGKIKFDDKSLKALQSEVDRTAKKLDTLYARSDKMQALGTDTASKSFLSLQYDIDITRDKLTGLNTELSEKLNTAIASTAEAMKQLEQVKTPTPEFQELEKSLEKAESHLFKLYDKQDKMNEMSDVGVRITASAYHNLQYEIGNAEAEVERLEKQMESMKSRGTAYIAPVNTSAYTDAAARLEDYQARLDSVEQRTAYDFERMSSEANTSASVIKAAMSKVASVFGSVANAVKKSVSHFQKMVKQSLNMDKAAKKLTKTLTSVFTMLKKRIKRKIMSAIFSDITYGFNQLAKQSPRFNKAFSEMLDSAKALGVQMVAAIEPIVSKLGPYISAITDELTKGAAAVAQFVAKLAGDSTFFKATKGQSNYAKSLENTESKTKKATAATNKLKSAVLGFDQLNKLQDNDSSSIGIDKPTLDAAMTESTALNAIAENIHDAYEKGDFVGVGKGLAEGIGAITQALAGMFGWSQNKDAITGVLTDISDVINGFSQGLIENGYQIGVNIADIGNTLVNGAAVLMEKISSLDLGAGIGQVLKGTIEGFDWSTLGADIVNGIEFALDFVTGVMNSGFLESLGTALSDAFKGMIEALDPEKWANALTSVVNSIFGFFASIDVTQEDFKTLGDKIVEFILTALNGLDWQKIQDGIGNILSILINAVAGLLRSLCEAIFSVDTWVSIGKAIYNAVMTVFVTVVNGIIDAFNAVIETINSIGSFQAPDFGFGDFRGQTVEFVHIDYVPKLEAPRLAGGGIIKGDGQVFIANEAGPELVGVDGRGNSAVMNNDQLIQAVSQGVRAAVVEAGTIIADRLAASGSDGGDVVIDIDSVELARAVNRGNKKIGRRSNHTVAFG